MHVDAIPLKETQHCPQLDGLFVFSALRNLQHIVFYGCDIDFISHSKFTRSALSGRWLAVALQQKFEVLSYFFFSVSDRVYPSGCLQGALERLSWACGNGSGVPS